MPPLSLPLAFLPLFWFDLASVHIVVSVLAPLPEVTETKRGAEGRDTNKPQCAGLSQPPTQGTECEEEPVACDSLHTEPADRRMRMSLQGEGPGWISPHFSAHYFLLDVHPWESSDPPTVQKTTKKDGSKGNSQ